MISLKLNYITMGYICCVCGQTRHSRPPAGSGSDSVLINTVSCLSVSSLSIVCVSVSSLSVCLSVVCLSVSSPSICSLSVSSPFVCSLSVCQ